MLRSVMDMFRSLRSLEARLERLQTAVGRIELRQLDTAAAALGDYGVAVFSQFGEDGVLHYLLSRVAIERRTFIEFGVESYLESNTRFLAAGRGWSGLVLDGSREHVEAIRRDDICWRYGLAADQAFVTAENINGLIESHGFQGTIGLLSIDVDGNDYWIWRAIERVSPQVVVIEYNALFGPERRVTVPYRPDFVRGKAHFSNLYFGASLAALVALGENKNYALVAVNDAGHNAFFVRRDSLGGLRPLSARDAYRRPCFRESRDQQGRLSFLDIEAAARLIDHLPLVEVD